MKIEPKFRHTRRRCGISLLETVTYISIGSLLMGMTIGWIHSTLHQGMTGRKRQRQNRALVRLEQNFRQDVRAAVAISMEDKDVLLVSQTDRVIRYKLSMDRQSVQKTVVKSGEPETLEQFAVGSLAALFWRTDEMPNWISLAAVKRPYTQVDPPRKVDSGLPTADLPYLFFVRTGPFDEIDSRGNDPVPTKPAEGTDDRN